MTECFGTQNKKRYTFLAGAVNYVKFQKYAEMESDIIKAMWWTTMIFGEEAISQVSKNTGNGGNSLVHLLVHSLLTEFMKVCFPDQKRLMNNLTKIAATRCTLQL